MDNTKQNAVDKEQKNWRIQVVEIGTVCVYCGTETEDACCGEVHHELGYETVEENPELILESELSQWHEILC